MMCNYRCNKYHLYINLHKQVYHIYDVTYSNNSEISRMCLQRRKPFDFCIISKTKKKPDKLTPKSLICFIQIRSEDRSHPFMFKLHNTQMWMHNQYRLRPVVYSVFIPQCIESPLCQINKKVNFERREIVIYIDFICLFSPQLSRSLRAVFLALIGRCRFLRIPRQTQTPLIL